jgi:hypothetical protein
MPPAKLLGHHAYEQVYFKIQREKKEKIKSRRRIETPVCVSYWMLLFFSFCCRDRALPSWDFHPPPPSPKA